MNAKAYSPGHVSSIFRVCMHANPFHSGSRGAGIVIDEGVITEVETVSGKGVLIYLNGDVCDFRPSIVMLEKMVPGLDEKIIIRHTTKLPVGAGFGVSAACVLGVGLCMNEIYSLDMNLDKIGQIAHVVEVECGTGLGDVGSVLVGGVELRKKEGAPGYGRVEKIDLNICDLICFSFGSVDTNKVIGGDGLLELNVLADGVLSRLFLSPTIENFMACSLEFAKNVGFLTRRLEDVIDRLNMIDGCFASQSMLGESGFVICESDMNKKVRDVLKEMHCIFETKVGYRLPGLV